MQADQPPFLPTAQPPAIHVLATPQHGSIPLVAESHGYHYLITGNTLLPDQRIHLMRARATYIRHNTLARSYSARNGQQLQQPLP